MHNFEAFNTQHSRKSHLPNSLSLDLTDRDATLRLIRDVRPNVIVNTAALTNVDYCETHEIEAESVNVGGVRNIIEAAQQTDCRVIQVSTDTVFDGSSGHYTESDTPNPINTYSRTKLDAEGIVSKLSNFAIARPSVVYGWHNQVRSEDTGPTKVMNFAMFILDKLKKNEIVRVVRDQYSSPTLADNLAEAILRLAKSRENGVFHTAGRSCMSRYEFAVKLAQVFGYPGGLMQPVFSSDFSQIAKRPRNSCLLVNKAEKTLGMRFLTAEEGVTEMKKQGRSLGDP